ncbi:MAG: hypothetical protein EP326_15350, partial [Deltaproteobacteria bacterium]
LTYNIWGLPYPISKRLGRFELIQKKLPKFDADIIALQEAFTDKAKVTTKSKMYPFKAHGPSSSFLNLSSGLVIMSKHPIIKRKILKFNECQGFDCFANKGVLFVRVMIDGEDLDVYSTHLNAEGDDEGPRFYQIMDFIEFAKENSTGRKAIFLGDFNFPDTSFLHNLFTTELSLIDSHQDYVQSNPDLPDDIQRGVTNSSDGRIDYVFTTVDIPVQKVEVVFKEKLYEGRQLSDHRAVLTTFEL